MLTLAAAMVDPSYGKLMKPPPKFHHAWQWNVLDIHHINYAAMDAYLCFNIQGLDEEREPSVRFKQRSISQEKRDMDEVEDMDEDSE